MSIKEIKKLNGLLDKNFKNAASKATPLINNKKKHEAEDDLLQANAAEQAASNADENVADMGGDLTTQTTPNGDSAQASTEGLLPQSLSGEASIADLSEFSAISPTEITSPLHGTQWAQARAHTTTDAGGAGSSADTAGTAAFSGINWGGLLIGGVAVAGLASGSSTPTPSGTVVSGGIMVGPIIDGHGLTVTVYKADGTSVTAPVNPDGSFTVNLGAYTGTIIAKVNDADGGNDFHDEATGHKDINVVLMTVDVITTTNITHTLNINPATTAAAVMAGLNAADGSGAITGADDAAQRATIQDANATIAAAIGLTGSLPGSAAIPVVNTDGTDNTANANLLGKFLAAMSGIDKSNGGDMAVAINALQAGITGTGATATLNAATQSSLIAGANNAGLSGAALAELIEPGAGAGAAELGETLDAQEVAALTPTVAANLTTAQIQSIATDDVSAIPVDALAAISSTALAGLGIVQLNQLTPEQLGALTGPQLEALTTAGKLNAIDLGAIGDAILGLSDAQLAALTADQLASLTADQVASLAGAGQFAATISGAPLFANLAHFGDDIDALNAATVATLTDAQLASLTLAQVTALDANGAFASLQVDLTATPVVNQVSALGNDIAGISAATLGGFSAAQLEALTAAQIGALATTAGKLAELDAADIAALGTDITGLSAAQVAALTEVQLAGITGPQAVALGSSKLGSLLAATQIAALSGAAIGSVSTSAIATQLSAEQLATLSPEQLAGLTPSQIGALAAADKLGSLDADDIAALGVDIKGLNAAQIAALSPVQLTALTQNQIAAIAADGDLADLTGDSLRALGTDIKAISAEQLALFTDQQLADLTADQISALATAGKLTALSGEQIAALGDDITALTAAQVNGLSTTQITGLTSEQASALAAAGDFASLDADHILALAPVAIDSVPNDVIDNLSPADVASLTLQQVQALTTGQLTALNTAGLLDDLAQDLSAEQIFALGFAGVDTPDEIALFNSAVQTASGSGALDLAVIAAGVEAIMAAVGADADSLTLANLQALGLDATEDNLAAIRVAIESTDAGKVNSINELRALVANASGELAFGVVNAADMADGTQAAVALPADLNDLVGKTLVATVVGVEGEVEITYEITQADLDRGYALLPLSLDDAQALGDGFVVSASMDIMNGSEVLRSGIDILTAGVAVQLTPPELQNLTPADDATHRITADLVLAFDETIAKGTGDIVLHKADGTVVETFAVAASNVTIDGQTLTINPAADLVGGDGYYVTVAAGAITDAHGNAWGGITDATTWSFTASSLGNTLDLVAVDNTVNATENASPITIGGALASDDIAVLAAITTGDFVVTLTPTSGDPVTVSVTAYNGNSGVWSGTVPADILLDGQTYTLTVQVTGSTGAALGNAAKSTATVVVDLSAATANVDAADIQSTASATVQSTETGFAYLVKDGETFTTVDQLNALANTDRANKVAILNPGTNTELSAAGLVEGNYHLYVVDDAGNISQPSVNTVTVDNSKPTASLTASIIKPSADVTVQSTEEGAAYLVANSITVNNLGSITTAADNAWNSVAIPTANQATQLAATGLADGVYKLYTVDKAGNLSVASTQTITIDNTTPELADANISISGATGVGDTYIEGDIVTATVVVTDANMPSTAGAVQVDFSQFGGGAAVNATRQSVNGISSTWTATYTIGAGNFNGVGDKNISATATDAAGNITTATDTTNATVDNVAPTAVLTTGITNTPATFNAVLQSDTANAKAYLVKTTVTDLSRANLDTLATAGVLAKTVNITAANTNTNLPTSGLVDGDYKLYTVDAAGNMSSASADTVTIDTVGPSTAPTVHTQATIYRDSATVTITGTWDNTNADGNGNYTLQSVTIDNVIYTSANGLTGNANGTWSLTHANIPALAAGTYHVTVTQADALGNTTSYTSSSTDNGDLNVQFRFSSVAGSSGLSVTTTSNYWGSTQGDINGDGYADIIIDGASGNDNLLVSNGNGTFSARSGLNVQTSSTTQSWSLGDFNGDGFLDTTQGTQVYLGTGLGTFTAGSTTGSGGDYVDIDGDGDLDIISMKSNGTSVLLNNGSAVFTAVSMATTGLTGAISNYCFALVDVNNDGRVDIWRLPYGSAGNQVFLNNGNGSFTAQVPITSGSDTFLGAALVDYDNDGFVDLYVNREAGGSARIYHNNQDGTFTDVSSSVMSGITANGARGGTTWLDFDGDGDLDIVSFESVDNVYRNNLKETGTATFTRVSNLTWSSANLTANSALVTDFNYDGALDLIASRPGTNTSSLLKNNTAIAGWLDVHVGNSRGITQWGGIVELFDSITGERVAVRHLVSGDYSSSQPDYVRFYGLDDSIHYDVRLTYGKDADGNANGTNVTKYVVTDGTAAYDVAGATMETNAAYNSINIGSGAGEVRSVYLTAEVGSNTDGSIQIGTALADAIFGDAGNDTITGNGGDDIIDLSAGGSDVVQYKLISTGGNGGNGLDTLLGFSTDILTSGGDKIDLSGLLVAGAAPTISGNAESASDQLGRIKLDVSAGTAVLSVDYDGTAGTASAGYQQLLTFTTSSTDAQALLNQMVTQGNLFFTVI